MANFRICIDPAFNMNGGIIRLVQKLFWLSVGLLKVFMDAIIVMCFLNNTTFLTIWVIWVFSYYHSICGIKPN